MQVKLFIGDCLQKLTKLKSKSVDVVVTSPPYNLGIKYKNYKDKLADPDYQKFMGAVAGQLKEILKDNGSFFINLSGTNTKPYLPLTLPIAISQHFVLQNTFVWVKSIAINGKTAGHYKPVNSKRFVNLTHEYIYHFTKLGEVEIDRLGIGVPYTDKSNLKRRGHKQDLKCAGSVWYIPYETRKEKLAHPASFPLELPIRYIKFHGNIKKLTVLDPFCGSGTTLLAAKQLGCKKAIGIDLSKEYIKMSKQRLKEDNNG